MGSVTDVPVSKHTMESMSQALSTSDAEYSAQGPVIGGASMQSRTRPPPLSRVDFGDCVKADGTRNSLDAISPLSRTSALGPESYRSDVAPDRLDAAPEENPRNGMSNGLKKLRHTLSKRVKGGQQVKVHKLNEMGEIVDKKGHRAWDMACALQLGIRVNVGMNSQASYSKVPDFETFQEHVKLKFPSKGSATTPPHSGASFQFKDYAPTIFRHLRDAFSIDTADYMVALCNTCPDGSNSLRIMGTPGKSGSLFFFSNDMRFIVKTLPKREAALLREILPAYYQHVKQHPGTYLPRFYGLHRWKPEFGSNVRFVVMNNVFATSLALHTRFDLKGSTLGRTASANERRKGPRAILKDLDFIESGTRIRLGRRPDGADRKAALLNQIRADCHLLMNLHIMDYSLLVGIHSPSSDAARALPPDVASPVSARPFSLDMARRPGGGLDARAGSLDMRAGSLDMRAGSLDMTRRTPSTGAGDSDVDTAAFNPGGIDGMTADGTLTGDRYFIGIIDILMLYTQRKKLENAWKTLAEGEGASSQPPGKYARRFCSFAESIMD